MDPQKSRGRPRKASNTAPRNEAPSPSPLTDEPAAKKLSEILKEKNRLQTLLDNETMKEMNRLKEAETKKKLLLFNAVREVLIGGVTINAIS